MSDSPYRVAVQAPVATITLDNPVSRNALSLAVLRELTAELDKLAGDESVRAIVIDAVGPAFSAGHDLREMRDRELDFYQELFSACADFMSKIHAIPQPVVAKIDGIATAAGCQLVASCDLAVASDRSTFATPGVRIGLFCSTPMVPVSRAVGRKRAMEMLLTGAPIDAARAVDWGLVNRAVPAHELDQAVDELLAAITGSSPHTIAIGKRAFYEQVELDEPAAYRFTSDVMAANAADDVAAEGVGAFLDKRDPVWPR